MFGALSVVLCMLEERRRTNLRSLSDGLRLRVHIFALLVVSSVNVFCALSGLNACVVSSWRKGRESSFDGWVVAE
jgi:hypothetical protein